MSDWTDRFFYKAYQLYEQNRLAASFRQALLGAKAGNPACMVWTAYLYSLEIKPDPTHKHEIFWYKKAWHRGEAAAAINLARVYKSQMRYGLARYWYLQSMNTGCGDAAVELASLYISQHKPRELIIECAKFAVNCQSISPESLKLASKILKAYTT